MDSASDNSIRVLVVEDNHRRSASAVGVLQQDGGFAVEHATGLDDAVERLNQSLFDVVLADANLADTEGLEVARRLRETSPILPIVLRTSMDAAEELLSGATMLEVATLADTPASGPASRLTLVDALEHAVKFGRFRTLVAELPNATLVVAHDSTVMFANAAAEALLGKSRATLMTSVADFELGDQRDDLVEITRPDGAVLVAHMKVAPLRWGAQQAFVVTLRQRSSAGRPAKIRQQIEAAGKEAQLTHTIRSVAHEMNNRNAILRSNLSVLDAEVRELVKGLETIRGTIERHRTADLAIELDRVLSEFKVHGRLQLAAEITTDSTSAAAQLATATRELHGVGVDATAEPQTYRANDAAHDAELALSPADAQRVARKDDGKVALIDADRGLVTWAIHALLRVALKRSTASVEVTTSATLTAVMIVIDDNTSEGGSFGATPKHSGEQTDTDHVLTLVDETARRLGGSLSRPSAIDVPGALVLELPAARPRQPSATSITDSGQKRGRILLIDDEPMLRRAVRRLLAPNHEVSEADNGRTAIELLAGDSAFDLIICDIVMPILDGPSLYAHLRDHHPHLVRKIVFVTGGSVAERTADFILAEKPIVLDKPVRRDVLLRVVAELVSGGTN